MTLRAALWRISRTPALCSSALLVLGPLQSTPSARALLATRLSLPDFSQHLGSLSFERANAATCDDHRLTRVGGNSGQVDFTQVDGCMNLSWRSLSFWHSDAHMQIEAAFQTKLHAPLCSGKSRCRVIGLRPLPMGRITRPGFFLTA